MLETEILIGRDAFRSLENDWRCLEASAGATVFQSWDWCDCWLNCFGRRVEPVIVKLSAGSRLTAIVPLVKSKTFFGAPIRRLSFIATGPSDYGGIAAQSVDFNLTDTLASALGQLKFDFLDLHQLVEEEALPLHESIKSRFNAAILTQEPTLTADMPTDFDAFLSTLSKKFKKNTIYADRRLRRGGNYKERSYGSADDIAEGMGNFFRLHQQRWLSKRLPGLFFSTRNRRFHRQTADRLAASGRLVLRVAFVGDEPAAAFYGFKSGDDYYYYLGGFDPKFAKHSVSSVLIFNLIKEAIGEQVKSFDFLRGREPYKKRWGAKPKPLYRLIAWPSTRRGRLGAKMAVRHNEFVQRARAKLHG